MANNRQIPRLEKLAFEAFLRYRQEYNQNEYEAQIQDNPVVIQHMKDDISLFMQYIADADPIEAEKLLQKNPLLATLASGTVTTVSGCTYENVSAIQLAYLMYDVEMCNMMLPYIKELSEDLRKKVDDELAKKMAEVEMQRAEFKPYDFSEIVKAITEDGHLKNTGQPSLATEKVLAKFKEYFKPGIIKEGKSWIKEHLQEGFLVYDKNWDPWEIPQLRWYLINVIGYMQTLTEKCFEQECSQRLKEIVDEEKPNVRTSTIKNYINDLPLTYRGSQDSSLLLGRDFFVEIYYGMALGWDTVVAGHGLVVESLKTYAKQKDQAWKNLSSSLTSHTQHTKRL